MMISGWANSDALLGTSLPTKGMASLSLDRGTCGSARRAALQSSEFNRPNETRFTFAKQCGR